MLKLSAELEDYESPDDVTWVVWGKENDEGVGRGRI
jgi:hypothetical protein